MTRSLRCLCRSPSRAAPSSATGSPESTAHCPTAPAASRRLLNLSSDLLAKVDRVFDGEALNAQQEQ